jgi:hypothetical protein
MYQATCSCLRLFRQPIPSALVLALPNAGNNIAARMAMMAITTSSSIKVKAREGYPARPRFLRLRTDRLMVVYWLRRREMLFGISHTPIIGGSVIIFSAVGQPPYSWGGDAG